MTPALEQIEALPEEMRAVAEHIHASSPDSKAAKLRAWADRIATALQALRDEAGEAVNVEAVARVVDNNGDKALDWLIEGRIDALPAGEFLCILDAPMADDGSLVFYTRPAPAAEAAPQGGVERAAQRVASFLDHANLDTSRLPTGMGSALRALRDALTATPPSAPAVDAEPYPNTADILDWLDVAHADELRNGNEWSYYGKAAALIRRLSAPVPQEGVPQGMIERLEAALKRVEDGRAPCRIPADPSDVDLALAEVIAWLKGEAPPFWIAAAPAQGVR